MLDYKSLFYESQAKISDLINQLEMLTSDLIVHMQNCEQSVIESSESETDEEDNKDV
ncbi:MAG: hypothetical protein K2K06_04365 [Oscillospiraceae bacterium]|nr:hypothetical protein [Ruminococcus sp.]MDE6707255.1 hypothetical protein [Oscillospiraceae bacterium]